MKQTGKFCSKVSTTIHVIQVSRYASSMARRTRFITVLISFLAFFVLTRARQRGRLAREPCESETTPSPFKRGGHRLHFRIFIGPLYVWLGLLILIRQLSLYVLPVRSMRVWSGPWFNVQTGATGIFGSLHVVRNRSSLGNVARPQSCVPSSSVSKRGSSELACLEWLSGGLGCQTLPCLRFSGSLSERGRVGRSGMVRVCVHLLFCGVISGGR